MGNEKELSWLPEAFLARMKQDLGEEYEAFLESYQETRVAGLRRNPIKKACGNLEVRMPFSLTPVPWCGTGYYYPEEERPGKHPYHEAGVYYIQEPSAMSVAELAAPEPGEYVLDLCAAPGGKTTHLAGKMKGRGLLVANEIIPSRAKILSQNVERLGIANAVVLNHAPEELVSVFPSFFDCIVVDAPCSGEGMFRKNPDACREWSPEQVLLCAERQRFILEQAAAMLAPGGRLIYSTCTFSRAENEDQVEHFLSVHPDFTLDRMERYYPHREKGEGHFAARLHLKGEKPERDCPETKRTDTAGSERRRKKKKAGGADETVYDIFFRELLKDGEIPESLPGELQWFGDNLYLVPFGMTDFEGIRTERPGLHLGIRKKGRFEPSHALALAVNGDIVRQSIDFPADSAEIAAYLQGLSLPAGDKKGWCLVMADGYSIGWGKAAGGILKNHYPKGLYKNLR